MPSDSRVYMPQRHTNRAPTQGTTRRARPHRSIAIQVDRQAEHTSIAHAVLPDGDGNVFVERCHPITITTVPTYAHDHKACKHPDTYLDGTHPPTLEIG
jgi:hypothetical protein